MSIVHMIFAMTYPSKGQPADGESAFLYINWLPDVREQEYVKLLEVYRPLVEPKTAEAEAAREQVAEKTIQINYPKKVVTYAFSVDRKRAFTKT